MSTDTPDTPIDATEAGAVVDELSASSPLSALVVNTTRRSVRDVAAFDPYAPFLAAVLGAPADDDTPRLLYADWFEEHGDERGELIRLEVELSSLDSNDPRRAALEQRRSALTGPYGRGLERACREALQLDDQTPLEVRLFWDGALFEVWAEAGVFLRDGEKVLDATPAAGASLELASPSEMRALARSPLLARLSSLRVGPRAGWDLAAFRDFARSPYLGNLRSLRLDANDLGDEAVADIAATPSLAGLVSLDLGSNWIRGDELRRLACLPNLRKLDLFWNGLLDGDVRSLAAFPALHTLNLGQNRLTAEEVRAIADSPLRENLTSLSVHTNDLDDASAEPLAAFTNLRALNLARNALGPQGIGRLTTLQSLNTLNLDGNGAFDAGAEALADKADLPHLHTLSFAANGVCDRGALALAEAMEGGGLARLRRLILTENPISPEVRSHLLERLGSRIVL